MFYKKLMSMFIKQNGKVIYFTYYTHTHMYILSVIYTYTHVYIIYRAYVYIYIIR